MKRSSVQRLAGLLLASSLMSGTAMADTRVIDGDGGALWIGTGAGNVAVRVGDRFEVRLEGQAGDLEAVDVSRDDQVLRVTRNVQSQTHISGDNVNIAIGDGAVSSVQIGGSKTVTTGDSAGPIHVKATVPSGTILHLAGATDQIEVGDTKADLVINCLGCSARLGELAALRVELTGDGDVEAERVNRRLEASITGNGQITIGDGVIDAAEVAIVGDGSVAFGGRSQDAAVTIVGQGEARFGHLDNPAATMIVGNGKVTVGN